MAIQSQAFNGTAILMMNRISGLSRSRIFWAAAFLILMTARDCRAENCPWLNAATAGGALGGTVTTNLVHTSREDITCEFKLIGNKDAASLTIDVQTMALPPRDFPAFLKTCKTPTTPLRGIGNEAIECSSLHRQGSQPDVATEIIVARVRERAFVLKWTFPAASDSIREVPREELQDKIRNLAEQIAGSLF
jgi:hypothetical protein